MTTLNPQFVSAKAASDNALLVFRMGDFYEMFHDDAKTAAKLLGLTLISSGRGDSAVPMAGFPYHQLDGYVTKLVASGQRVAVVEPATA